MVRYDIIDNIFAIDKENILSDSENYYFFRALNKADTIDITNKDNNGNIKEIRTDRQRFNGQSKYQEASTISLEEVNDHVKWHHSHDTNCISLTSNPNVACIYGRQLYNNSYLMIKIPKEDINNKVYNSALYLIKEINKRIDSIKETLSYEQQTLLDEIDNITTTEEINNLYNRLQNKEEKESLFKTGINLTSPKEFIGLTKEQSLEKDKLLLKLDLINTNIIPNYSNWLLMETIKNSFSSSEYIHYNSINASNIKEVSSELMDIYSIIFQVPNNIPNIDELKSFLITYFNNNHIEGTFKYNDYKIDSLLSLENMYSISNKLNINISTNLAKKIYYYAKSKVRAYTSIHLLKQIVGNNPKYQEIISYLETHSYGIEPEIVNKFDNNNLLNLSDAVNLDFTSSERNLLNYIKTLDINTLNNILINPIPNISNIIKDSEEEKQTISLDKNNYYATNLINLYDFKSLNIQYLSEDRKQDFIDKLEKYPIVSLYNKLLSKNISYDKIPTILINFIISLDNNYEEDELLSMLDSYEFKSISLDELETFLDYNQVKGIKLTLYPYQKMAAIKTDEILESKRYVSNIMPTGTGKSYLSIYEIYKRLLENPNAKILYLAPNVEILNQLKSIMIEELSIKKHLNQSNMDCINTLYPNLVLATYQDLPDRNNNEDTIKDIYKQEYDFIICDELHRTGASKWEVYVKELFEYNKNTKVMGITATPERDTDNKNMSDAWARYFGYTEEEIIKCKHEAINMELYEAIASGYAYDPKIINCFYTLIENGNLESQIKDIEDIEVKEKLLEEYKNLKEQALVSSGIEEVVGNNLSTEGIFNKKFIVFLPVTKKDDGTYEDEYGNTLGKTQAQNTIKNYQLLMRQYILGYNFYNNNKNIIESIYNKLSNNITLSIEEENFIDKEKDNIIALDNTQIFNQTQNISSYLNSRLSKICLKIIEYKKYQRLNIKTLNKLLREKTDEFIDDYSMLGQYSNLENEHQLDAFNKPTNNKTKLMFVMNKLNEGVHVKGINGIVWLREMDEFSRILFYQQLGRCIHTIKPGEQIKEEDIPIVLDLVNNTLRVKLSTDISIEELDLNNTKQIVNWYLSHNNTIPNINTNNKEEQRILSLIILIYNRYNKYNDSKELNELSNKRKLIIEEILSLGSTIDIWNMDLPRNNKDVSYINSFNNDINSNQIFANINILTKGFLELYNKVNNYSIEKINGLEKNKVLSFLSNIEDNKLTPGSTSHFFNSKSGIDYGSMNSFWTPNKSKFYDLSTNPSYQDIQKLYPNAINIILSTKDITYIDILGKKYEENKILSYLNTINQNANLSVSSDTNFYDTNSNKSYGKMKNFWFSNKDELCYLATNKNYSAIQELYPIAVKKISIIKNMQFIEISGKKLEKSKIIAFLTAIDKEEVNLSSNLNFYDNDNDYGKIKNFWTRYKEQLSIIATSNEYIDFQNKYPNAIKKINSLTDILKIGNKKLEKNKVYAFFDTLENNSSLTPGSTTNFSNSTKEYGTLNSYWGSNKNYLYEIASSPNYSYIQEMYPNATKKIISTKEATYLKINDKNLELNKAISYLECLEKTDATPSCNKKFYDIKTNKDNGYMFTYWRQYNNELYELISNKIYSNIVNNYPNAIDKIKSIKESKYYQNNNSRIDQNKIIAFFYTLETNESLTPGSSKEFTDESKNHNYGDLTTFWASNREELYNIATSPSYTNIKELYPNAITKIIKSYQSYKESKWAKTITINNKNINQDKLFSFLYTLQTNEYTPNSKNNILDENNNKIYGSIIGYWSSNRDTLYELATNPSYQDIQSIYPISISKIITSYQQYQENKLQRTNEYINIKDRKLEKDKVYAYFASLDKGLISPGCSQIFYDEQSNRNYGSAKIFWSNSKPLLYIIAVSPLYKDIQELYPNATKMIKENYENTKLYQEALSKFDMTSNFNELVDYLIQNKNRKK